MSVVAAGGSRVATASPPTQPAKRRPAATRVAELRERYSVLDHRGPLGRQVTLGGRAAVSKPLWPPPPGPLCPRDSHGPSHGPAKARLAQGQQPGSGRAAARGRSSLGFSTHCGTAPCERRTALTLGEQQVEVGRLTSTHGAKRDPRAQPPKQEANRAPHFCLQFVV